MMKYSNSVTIESPDGRVHGTLVAEEPLSPADRRAVRALAMVVGRRLGEDEWAEGRLREPPGCRNTVLGPALRRGKA